MPAGVEVTVPLPLPLLPTDSVYVLSVNVAVTEVAAVIATVHVPVPLHPPPLQPMNIEPVDADAVSVTAVPWLYASEQSEPHEIPPGDELTVPLPPPLLPTDSVYVLSVNVAVTVFAASIVTVHVPMLLQPAPLQHSNYDAADDDAGSVTVVPWP